jgi:hypothetical protein
MFLYDVRIKLSFKWVWTVCVGGMFTETYVVGVIDTGSVTECAWTFTVVVGGLVKKN